MLEEYWPSILTLMSLQIVGLISPGPDFAVVVRNSLIFSRRTGVLTAFGVSFGIMVHLAYILLGLGIFISKTAWLFHLIKYMGGGYLIYIGILGLKAKKGALNYGDLRSRKDISSFAAFQTGFLTNAMNIKAMLFFLSLVSAFMTSKEPAVIIFIYGAIIFFTTLIWFIVVAYCFSHQQLRTFFSNLHHWVERVTGGLLFLLGVKILFMENSIHEQ
ncbi:MAG: lysine transporter LysE [Alphaproteobacteria bacterium]|nr:lysine transporter LysE [Alphaproteobacteria bacterium]